MEQGRDGGMDGAEKGWKDGGSRTEIGGSLDGEDGRMLVGTEVRNDCVSPRTLLPLIC